MKEIIEKIEESDLNGFDGYVITTNERVIKLLIDNSQCCCESWGYCDTADDLKDFIGDELIKINTVCCDQSNERFKQLLGEYEYDSLIENAEFIELVTNSGVLTFAVYNSHNGYYGHNVLIQIGDNIEESCL